MSAVRRWAGRLAGGWQRARSRHGWLDHTVRALIRYDKVDAGRLSAALTYYAFFATFALGLLGFAVLSRFLDHPAVLAGMQRYLSDTFPRLDVQALRDAGGTAGLVACVVLPLTGLFWMDTLLSLSLAAAFAAEWVLTWLAVNTVGVQAAPAQWMRLGG